MTADVGGGAGGVFGVAGGLEVDDAPWAGDAPVPGVFWTLWSNGSLVANSLNSVSWPGVADACTEEMSDGDELGVLVGTGGIEAADAAGVDAPVVGVDVAGADASAVMTGAFAFGCICFNVLGTSKASTSTSTALSTIASFFCFAAFACARSA
jgi:hypothetical protein